MNGISTFDRVTFGIFMKYSRSFVTGQNRIKMGS